MLHTIAGGDADVVAAEHALARFAVVPVTGGDARSLNPELSDPFGLIRSCGIASDDKRVRFVLNVSTSQRTKTARTISASGAGVHHIALATKDIFATMDTLRGEMMRFVPISPNYYDDIIARLDLPRERVDAMRGLGILYDKTTGAPLWEFDPPLRPMAAPMTYSVNGKQYVVVAAGGGLDAQLIAFTLGR